MSEEKMQTLEKYDGPHRTSTSHMCMISGRHYHRPGEYESFIRIDGDYQGNIVESPEFAPLEEDEQSVTLTAAQRIAAARTEQENEKAQMIGELHQIALRYFGGDYFRAAEWFLRAGIFGSDTE